MNTGDSVYCVNDLPYKYKGEDKVVKSGHIFIIKQDLGDKVVCDRFGKMFIIEKTLLKLK